MSGEPQFEIPLWVKRVAAATWITDSDHRIVYLNAQAEGLLGVRAVDAIQRACHEVFAASDLSGSKFCGEECPFRSLAMKGERLTPRVVSLGPRGAWVDLLAIPLHDEEPRGGYIVHFGIDRGRPYQHLMHAGLRLVRDGAAGARKCLLTPRETQILGLLAEGLDHHAIATKLHVSYVTVRNHVRNLLKKLRVHSVREAIVLYLVEFDAGSASD